MRATVTRAADALRRLWPVLVWPLLALAIGAGWWTVMLSRADQELQRAERAALKDVASYAESYAAYVARSVGHMDQVTMQLKRDWEQSRERFRLEDLKNEGMFTDPAFLAVSIADRDGVVSTSTARLAAQAPVTNTDFFVFHKNNNSTALRIGAAPGPAGGRQTAVQFTRRLEGRDDDDFDGVVILTVDATYFTAFYGAKTLGGEGMLALLGADGALRLEHYGDPAALAGALRPAALPPVGDTEGAALVAGAGHFADGKERILGWHPLSSYPLTALVGIARAEAMAGAHANRDDGIRHALLASLCLALLAGAGAELSRRALLRKHGEDEVQRAYRTATESANDGFYMAAALRDAQGRIVDFEVVDCNERGAFFYGLSRAELIGTRLSSTDSSVFSEDLLDTYKAAMATGYYEDDRQMPSDNRFNISWGHRRLVRVGNGLAITLQDISERKAHEDDLLRLANQDALTGLPNRYWLINAMPAVLARARAANATLALLFIDLDEFKHVNDTQGHAVGDELLQMAAARLSSLLRPGDQVVRFGGDEFIVVLNPAGDDAHLVAVAERILTAFAAPFPVGADSASVGASVGISVFPRDGQDTETLIKHGDIAMYAGKSEGKGQYRFFDPALYHNLKTRAQLKQRLLEAIEQDQLTLHFQARVDTQTGELCSMEALLRWVHPSQGTIAPLDFIPLAESSGLILRIGQIVMAKACAQLAAWRAQGLPLVPVSINVSPKQFAQGGIHLQLAAQLARYDIPPRLLEVEITESAMMGDQDEIIAELSAIRALGVRLHVDDFGTGYSSLSQLQKLKMDVLKVDRAFTCELGKSREGEVFFQAIVSMAHALGMAIVAEGVENAQQLRILQALSCNEAQGYYIARPLPAQDMAALMQRRYLLPAPAGAA